MKPVASIAIALIAATLGGCYVVPPRPVYVAPPPPPPRVVYAPPPGVVYVAPTYAAPGPGWVWEYHATYGWGWRHPQYGWHRGWR